MQLTRSAGGQIMTGPIDYILGMHPCAAYTWRVFNNNDFAFEIAILKVNFTVN